MKKLPQDYTAPTSSRREMFRDSGRILAAGVLAGANIPQVHAAEDNTLQVVLIGCGGRGAGAASNCLSVQGQGPIKLIGMADVFQNRLGGSLRNLTRRGLQVDVPKDRQFIGFDAYKQAMDLLRPGDVAILATPPAFRWPHFTYAIEKGIHVFMEKPITVDGPSTKRMFALGKEAEARNLKVGVGLMCRHCEARQELYKRIQDGEIGDIICQRAYRMAAPIASFRSQKRSPEQRNELLWQISRFHSFLWASGGAFSDFYVHNIDETCWMKNDWPEKAQGTGGRHYRGDYVDQNFDSYSVEYTYNDGAKFFLYGRCMDGCHDEFASYVHGSKGMAVISTSGHSPAKCRIYSGQKADPDKLVWKAKHPEPHPYQLEWNHLIAAIRQDQPYNEIERGARASMVTALGRMAVHTGQEMTYEDALNSPHELAPHVDQFTLESTPPVTANAEGKYPVPMPGIYRDREYQPSEYLS